MPNANSLDSSLMDRRAPPSPSANASTAAAGWFVTRRHTAHNACRWGSNRETNARGSPDLAASSVVSLTVMSMTDMGAPLLAT